MKLKKHKKRVENLLIAEPKTRDDNRLLLSLIWSADCANKGLNPKYILAHLANNQLTDAQSIFRCSRKLQQENPELRGAKRNRRLLEQTNVQYELLTFNE